MTANVPFFATTLTVLTAALPAIATVELPRGDPPPPAARRINVADFGASLADDDRDDTPAVSAAIKAATNNCTLYFPAGTYNVKWVAEIENFDWLSLQGDGPDKSILKRMGPFWKPGAEQTWENLRANYATDSKLLRIEDCQNMCIRDLGFDANGTPTFGGIGIKRPKRLHIANTRSFDSREQPPLFGKDRFAWAIMGFAQGSEDSSPTAKINERFKVYIWYNCWAGEDRLNQTVIRGNRLYADGLTKPLVVIQRDNQSVGLIVEDNTVQPYSPPPGIPEMISTYRNRGK